MNAQRTEITGKHLITWGFTPGSHFKSMLETANRMYQDAVDINVILIALRELEPPPLLQMQSDPPPIFENIEATNVAELDNIRAVRNAMGHIAALPTVRSAAIMPDACPTGPTDIPVGGVVATEGAIHPGFHSSDICCSVMMSNLGNVSPAKVMDAAMVSTKFGIADHRDKPLVQPEELYKVFETNPFLADLIPMAIPQLGTQGDGNHFFYVGILSSTGDTVIVTHHGSRKLGATLYKKGITLAQKQTNRIAEGVAKSNAWITADTRDGDDYWEALQLIRKWTKANHAAIHHGVAVRTGATVSDRFWNEHNFVFRKSDGLFYHGKGATPAWADFAEDTDGRTLIPLNMAEPILIARGNNHPHALGFAPHGAGRNFSRKAHIRSFDPNVTVDSIVAEETHGLDVRFWCGEPDISELPSAYKNARTVHDQIKQFALATIEDTVQPYGSIMAGDWLTKFKEKKNAQV